MNNFISLIYIMKLSPTTIKYLQKGIVVRIALQKNFFLNIILSKNGMMEITTSINDSSYSSVLPGWIIIIVKVQSVMYSRSCGERYILLQKLPLPHVHMRYIFNLTLNNF